MRGLRPSHGSRQHITAGRCPGFRAVRQDVEGAFSVITGLDHVVVLTQDIAAGAASYQTLFAPSPAWQNNGDGAHPVPFTLDNMSLELKAPSRADAHPDPIRNVLALHGQGLARL